MRTQMMIMLIVVTMFLACVAVFAALVFWLGWLIGFAVAMLLSASVVGLYIWVVRPWHMRWGATDEEVDRVIAEYQHLEPGDKILMMPDMGFVVQAVDDPRSIVSVLEDGSTSWCLALYTTSTETRLVSRWRPKLERNAATFFMTLLTEPGTFIMEQKMLRTIRDRVES